jgi:hypothetical protein
MDYASIQSQASFVVTLMRVETMEGRRERRFIVSASRNLDTQFDWPAGPVQSGMPVFSFTSTEGF